MYSYRGRLFKSCNNCGLYSAEWFDAGYDWSNLSISFFTSAINACSVGR